MVKNPCFNVSTRYFFPSSIDLIIIISKKILLNYKIFAIALRGTMIDLCNEGDLQGALYILKDIIQINNDDKSDDFGNMTLRSLLRAVARLSIVSISYILLIR